MKNRGKWFLGESQVDPGEWDYDGRIWEAPAEDDIRAALAEGRDPEPWLVAEHVERDDAELIVRAVNAYGPMVAALQAVVGVSDHAPPVQFMQHLDAAVRQVKAALRQTE